MSGCVRLCAVEVFIMLAKKQQELAKTFLSLCHKIAQMQSPIKSRQVGAVSPCTMQGFYVMSSC